MEKNNLNNDLKTEAFDYELPESLVAQEPLTRRDDSRLLVLERNSGLLEHSCFRQLPRYLKKGDLLVLNDSRVFPARLLGKKERGGPVELFLLQQQENGDWQALCRPGKRAKPGAKLIFGDGELVAEVRHVTAAGERIVRMHGKKPLTELVSALGKVPLPPYIKKELHDAERYQTVYARKSGSVAAPTAGLHFTEEVFNELSRHGIAWTYLTLHVGPGTFRPVKTEYVTQHSMHKERYTLEPAVADQINDVKNRGSRVVAVGTTCCRVLETQGDERGKVHGGEGETDLYITPGYHFKVVDALITNFHLPRSTLLMLVSALAGREETLQAYAEAVKEGYRFYSFGDAMLII